MPEDEKTEDAENGSADGITNESGTRDEGAAEGGGEDTGGPEDGPPIPPEPEGGPFARQREFLTERMSLIRPRDPEDPTAEGPMRAPVGPGDPGAGRDAEGVRLRAPIVFEPPETPGGEESPPAASRAPQAPESADTETPAAIRQRAIDAYHERRARNRSQSPVDEDGEETPPPRAPGVAGPPQPPAAPPANNWVPLGPAVLRKGQGATRPATSGRTPGIAVAPGGQIVYAAAANGGVWRSDDGGISWRSLMDAFDMDPLAKGTISLACGAVAIDPANPDRIYLGSGEGAPGLYLGVGPVVSSDGGATWQVEPSAPSLLGSAFFELAVDPTDPDRVVGATHNGLYRREAAPGGGHTWTQRVPVEARSTWFSSVVSALRGDGTSVYYAASWYGPVFRSTDGDTWARVGAGFPANHAGRITLAIGASDPEVVYALVADRNGALLGLWRLDTSTSAWTQVHGVPSDLFGLGKYAQGRYDQALAVDPQDSNLVYAGGSTVQSGGAWSGSIYRCPVTSSGSGVSTTYQTQPTYIGGSTHADIHTLVFTPGQSDGLWVGCDGGVYFSDHPKDDGHVFVPRNTGLSTLTMNHLAQHPTEEAVLFCGTQDNGGARYTGEEAWLHSVWGDSGHFVINWHDPYRIVATYVGSSVNRNVDGGSRYRYSGVDVPMIQGDQSLFYAPLIGTPTHPGAPAEAERIAFGGNRPWISDDFGDHWYSLPSGSLADLLGPATQETSWCIKSMRFASHARLYVGLMSGHVYRYDESGGAWTRTRLDTVGPVNERPPLGVVTDIAMDPADASGDSIYMTLGGTGDPRHVWHFDGARWESRSGSAAGGPSCLLDVQHNTIIIDPNRPADVFVGADIGVWHSTDAGATWSPLSDGLPDAPVLDLDIHENRRLLRASTHGRGVFEWALDAGPTTGVRLVVRDTRLDRGRTPSDEGLPDPIAPGDVVTRRDGPDIRTHVPDASGTYAFPPGQGIDFLEFTDALPESPTPLATHATETITSRVFVLVHNRDVTPANDVQVVLLLADLANGMPPLPNDYWTRLVSGDVITDLTGNWVQVDRVTLQNVRADQPKVAAFDVPSTLLPKPADLAGHETHCVLALVHHAIDPWSATETDPDALVRDASKAAYREVHIVPHTGAVPVDPLVPISP